MGQTVSSSQPDLIFWVDLAEKFQSQFRYWVRYECLTELVEAFKSHVSISVDETTPNRPPEVISEGNLSFYRHELVDTLSTVVPVDLEADLDVAGALLFQTMIRLGCFPFHNLQTPSRLGLDAVALAIIFLQRKHKEVTGFTLDDGDDDGHREKIKQLRDRWFHRLLFQVLSDKPRPNSQNGLQGQDECAFRDAVDDEYLIQTRKLLVEYNNGRDERAPGVLIQFPPVIEISELPSSKSGDLDGTIPKERFQSLLNIICRMANHSFVDIGQLVEAPGIGWHGFEAIVSKLEPHFSF